MEARRREAREKRIGFRGRIVGMHEAGQSIRAIANNLGISTRTVRRWIRRAEDTDCINVASSYVISIYHCSVSNPLK
ncbi:hypothetical protein Pcinc_019749 [Petrolisthes cinctipes]|uniref:Uncharacterized protein n=1 Tax=Petrolisthes cinctipes TaxID=88211 RepID=A0AAE1FJI8_PETCI|nr:hypothetical protein Pcinc_019749 [Petrolisthes cinctipes]